MRFEVNRKIVCYSGIVTCADIGSLSPIHLSTNFRRIAVIRVYRAKSVKRVYYAFKCAPCSRRGNKNRICAVIDFTLKNEPRLCVTSDISVWEARQNHFHFYNKRKDING
jgi:hypothetical protein